ncbi:MAG TPA: hypothetical protein VF661_04200 [Actinomycetales bacterium]|jgi:hypothetical protein
MSDAVDTLRLPDDGTVDDLVTYLGRAAKVDPGGATRLVARDGVLACYVSPVHGGGGPTVLGLRVLRLAQPVDVDTTVPLAALADRFARLPPSGRGGGGAGAVEVPVPPQQAGDAPWAGISPPRSGWQVQGAISRELLLEAARAGVEQVATGTPEGSGSAAVARLRALVWGRDVGDVPGLPSGAAYAAQALGFIGADEPVALYAVGAWRRLTTSRGHVLARPPLLP